MNTNNRQNGGEPIRREVGRMPSRGASERNSSSARPAGGNVVRPDSAFLNIGANPQRNARSARSGGPSRNATQNSHSAFETRTGDGSGARRENTSHTYSPGRSVRTVGKYAARPEPRKNNQKPFEFNSTIIVIIVSVFLSVSILGGALVNHYRSTGEDEGKDVETGDTGNISGGESNDFDKTAIYSLDASEVDPDIVFPVIKVTDEDGRVIFSPIRAENGDIEGTAVYEYDGEGNRISEKKYGKDGRLVSKNVPGGREAGVFSTLYETEFDEKNNYVGYTETFFDENGELIEKYECAFNGVIEGKFTYEYDEEGRVSLENRFTPYGELAAVTKYKFDEFGNNVEVIQSDANGKEVLREVRKYDGEKRVVLEEYYILGVCRSYVEYTYDADGKAEKRNFVLRDEHTMTYEEIFY